MGRDGTALAVEGAPGPTFGRTASAFDFDGTGALAVEGALGPTFGRGAGACDFDGASAATFGGTPGPTFGRGAGVCGASAARFEVAPGPTSGRGTSAFGFDGASAATFEGVATATIGPLSDSSTMTAGVWDSLANTLSVSNGTDGPWYPARLNCGPLRAGVLLDELFERVSRDAGGVLGAVIRPDALDARSDVTTSSAFRCGDPGGGGGAVRGWLRELSFVAGGGCAVRGWLRELSFVADGACFGAAGAVAVPEARAAGLPGDGARFTSPAGDALRAANAPGSMISGSSLGSTARGGAAFGGAVRVGGVGVCAGAGGAGSASGSSSDQPEARSAIRFFVSSPRRRRLPSSSGTGEP